ncbi:hypothetical protein OK006_5452 [Actinobacteria bacterium OK006]|nr:hypothetical protein OK006_5452 [Actinobacteria bacterium OK006]
MHTDRPEKPAPGGVGVGDAVIIRANASGNVCDCPAAGRSPPSERAVETLSDGVFIGGAEGSGASVVSTSCLDPRLGRVPHSMQAWWWRSLLRPAEPSIPEILAGCQMSPPPTPEVPPLPWGGVRWPVVMLLERASVRRGWCALVRSDPEGGARLGVVDSGRAATLHVKASVTRSDQTRPTGNGHPWPPRSFGTAHAHPRSSRWAGNRQLWEPVAEKPAEDRASERRGQRAVRPHRMSSQARDLAWLWCSTESPWATNTSATSVGGNRPCSTTPGVAPSSAARPAGSSTTPW